MTSINIVHQLRWLLVTSILMLASCNNLIEYSPYQAGIGAHPKRNVQVVDDLGARGKEEFTPFKIALIGDSHTYYDDLEDQVRELNKIDSIDFVVHMGDLTLSGIHREFIWYNDITGKLRHPLITIIGNHDYLSNGAEIYKEEFGPVNFTLDYRNCRLVFFDNIVWEKNVQDPDFQWLYQACDAPEAEHRVVFAHIPPWDEQMSIGNTRLYDEILTNNEVDLSVHGHIHRFFYGYKEAHLPPLHTPFLVTGDSQDREIVILELRADTLLVNRKKF